LNSWTVNSAFRFCGLVLLTVLFVAGCAATRNSKVALPRKHSLKADQLLIVSDFKIESDHPLILDLLQLRKQVAQTLAMPLGTKQVMVYLFSTETQYKQYWEATYPGFPLRRAYFVQTPAKELAVYTAWSERIQEDLRHEFTHGLLHASLESVPLWLDEGLAEYFEVIGPSAGQVNPDYAHLLMTSVQNGWRPDMRRLETLEAVKEMQRADYRESWAWTHWMLHGSDEGRDVLLGYLRELRTNPNPGRLSDRILADVPAANERLVAYVTSLPSVSLMQAGATSERANNE
jgi:hypothetical protein